MINILEWIIWGVALIIFIIHIFLFFHSDPGVSRLAKRYSFLIAIGLIVTAFTKFSKFHLIWWAPVAYVFNLLTLSAGVRRGAKKFIKDLKEDKNEDL